MAETMMMGLGLARSEFQVHGADASERLYFAGNFGATRWRRFLQRCQRACIRMQACGGAHYWARLVEHHGHNVHIMPPAYVKPWLQPSQN